MDFFGFRIEDEYVDGVNDEFIDPRKKGLKKGTLFVIENNNASLRYDD